MSRRSAIRERGVALLAFVAVIGIVATWFLVKQLNLESGGLDAARKQRTAEVLAEAKRALMGYVAHQAAITGENNPGVFPCPETPAGYDSTTGLDGRVQSTCISQVTKLPAVGRFPWRTIGTDKLVDAYGEPLWYVVASGWGTPTTGNTVINSNCTDAVSAMDCWTGQLTVDGQANAAVALIIAPGPAMRSAAATGCTATNQVRSVVGPPDRANWLECENATNPADATFVTTGASGSFNDQVITITAAEILPLIEAAVADRFQQEFAPSLRTAYSGTPWASPTAPTPPVYAVSSLPFAVEFGNPTVDPGRKFQGAAPISTGTAAVANGSATVTLSAPATPSLVGKHFKVQGYANPSFLIASHTVGSAVLTLSSAFSGTTSGAASYQIFAAGGLLPATYAYTGQCDCSPTPCVCTTPTACTVGSDNRCDPAFVAWSGGTISRTGGARIDSPNCTVSGSPTILTCTLNTYVSLADLFSGISPNWTTFNLQAVANNVGRTWRKLHVPPAASPAITGIDTTFANSPIGYNVTSATMNASGSATITINARVQTAAGSLLSVLGGLGCNLLGFIPVCAQYTVTVPMALLGDQEVLDPNNSATNWFFRNKWHEVSYYAASPEVAPSGPLSCTTSGTCLQVTRHVNEGKHRGVLIIGGPKLGTQVRPATTSTDLLDGLNAGGASPFEFRSTTLLPNRAFNDHFAVIDSN
jgi:hypothetical protein